MQAVSVARPRQTAGEPAVSRHRARLDRAAAWGVPAHVTILYPFVAPSAITAATMAALAGAVASVRAFDCEFPATKDNLLHASGLSDHLITKVGRDNPTRLYSL